MKSYNLHQEILKKSYNLHQESRRLSSISQRKEKISREIGEATKVFRKFALSIYVAS